MPARYRKLFSLRGRTALVIGGAGYLGSQISDVLAEMGATVVVASRDLVKCRSVSQEIARCHGVRSWGMKIDAFRTSSVQKGMKSLFRREKKLDILVNCFTTVRKNSFESISEKDWKEDMDIGINGVFRSVKTFFPLLKSSRGVILNIASMYGYLSPDYRIYEGTQMCNPPSYGAAKAATIQFTKYLSSFLSPYGIRVNCLSPGPFPHTGQQMTEFIRNLGKKNPLGRIGLPHEVKGAAALLCSDASRYMTGQNLRVDGGWGVW